MNITFSSPNRFVKNFRKVFDQFFSLSNEIRILDFGGGDGTISIEIAKDLNVPTEIIVVDDGANYIGILPDNVKYKKVRKIEDCYGKFNIILASASLEHVTKLKPLLDNIFIKLDKGGLFYARTPYVMPFKKIFGRFVNFGYPAHIHDLGCEYWNLLPARYPNNELEIIKSRPSIIEAGIEVSVVRWLLAFLLKAPSRIETALLKKGKSPFWKFCGGWEVYFKKK